MFVLRFDCPVSVLFERRRRLVEGIVLDVFLQFRLVHGLDSCKKDKIGVLCSANMELPIASILALQKLASQ
jgi:hypothetical protein